MSVFVHAQGIKTVLISFMFEPQDRLNSAYTINLIDKGDSSQEILLYRYLT